MSKTKPIFIGAATALVTPFVEGEIDYDAFGNMIDFQINNSIDALVVAGTTGEASTLSEGEYEELIQYAVEKNAGRVPLIAGSGSNDTKKACRLTELATKMGVDACLVVTPYYNKANSLGLTENYRAIASHTDLPIIVYNVPTRTCVNISLDVYREIAKIDNIVAVKEASPDITACAELIFECGNDLDIYTGSDDQILPTLSIGGLGTISVVSNLIPREIHEICMSYRSGDTLRAYTLFKKYYPLMRAMFSEVNPIPVKTALSMLGKCKEEFRLPLCRISELNRNKLEKILKEHGIFY